MPKPRGRPPKAPAERRSKRVSVRFTVAEWKHLKDKAAWIKVGLCDYLRDKGLSA